MAYCVVCVVVVVEVVIPSEKAIDGGGRDKQDTVWLAVLVAVV